MEFNSPSDPYFVASQIEKEAFEEEEKIRKAKEEEVLEYTPFSSFICHKSPGFFSRI